MRGYHNCIMSLVPTLLAGEAAAWFNSLRALGTAPVTWLHFRTLIEDRFGNPYREEDARDKFDSLRPSRTVAQTRAALEQLLPDLTSMSERDLVHQFQRKLVGTVRFELERAGPQTLEEAFKLGESIERADRLSRPPPSLGLRDRAHGSGPQAYGRQASMHLNAMRGDPHMPPLTRQERDELMATNGCFFCKQPNAGHWSDECPHRPTGRGTRPSGPQERRARPGNGRGRGR